MFWAWKRRALQAEEIACDQQKVIEALRKERDALKDDRALRIANARKREKDMQDLIQEREGHLKQISALADVGDELKTRADQAELWAIVEVMGHARYAGRVSEYAELGVPLVRVEVPAANGEPAFEKLLGAASIFRVTPCAKEAAIAAAQQFHVRPLSLVRLPSASPAEPEEKYGPDYLDDNDDEY